MRSSGPWRDNPWPHDMVIRVDDTPNALLTLLFVRSAWGLAPQAGLPGLDPPPAGGTSAPPATATRDEWSARWLAAWERAWTWYELPDAGLRPPTPQELASLGPGGPLIAPIPPMWETEHGPDGIDRTALNDWTRGLRDPHPVLLDRQPERRNLDALIPAWRAGIDSVVVLPYRGYYARRVGTRHLVVSRTTRDTSELYDRALASVL